MKADAWLLFAALALLLLACWLSVGCSQYTAWDRSHERTYAVSYDADSQTGAISMTIRPAAGSAPTTPPPAAGMSDETIARIVKLISEQAIKAQDVTNTPALQ